MVDLNDLRVFDKVAAFNSFSAGASELGLPKSSVSRSISRLEAELGIRLFQRSTRSVQLTPAGKALLDRCRTVLGDLSEAIDYAASLAGKPAGTRARNTPPNG